MEFCEYVIKSEAGVGNCRESAFFHFKKRKFIMNFMLNLGLLALDLLHDGEVVSRGI